MTPVDQRGARDGSKRPPANANRNAFESFGLRCVHCGADLSSMPKSRRHGDHRIPRSRFESQELRRWFRYRDCDFNIVASCAACNMKKRAEMPPKDHPLTVRFFLGICVEEFVAAWKTGAPIPLDVLAYWSAHEGIEREGAELHMEDRKTDVCRRTINECFMERNDNHYIAKPLLYSTMVEDVIKAFGHNLAVLCRGLRSACDAVCCAGEYMHSLGVQKHWWDEDVRFLGEVWPAHCRLAAQVLAMAPVPVWERSPLVRLDEEYDMVDELAGCRE